MSAADPLKQVGKTVGGIPVAQRLISLIAAVIAERLALTPASDVLELCCGNGLITRQLARKCRSIVAVDFSSALIATARQSFAASNITYLCGDAMSLDDTVLARGRDAIIMQEAIQHFTPEQADALLARIAASPAAQARLYFGAVPDAAKLSAFYNTPERQAQYLDHRAKGTEPVGTWWTRAEIIAMAGRHGYAARVLDQHPELHTAHYRFDVICEPVRA